MFNIAKKSIKVKQQLAKKPEKNSQMGISIIEVLIVVSILLLLMVALYRTIGRDVDKARDTDRKKDLKDIKIAFENYYNDKGCYPQAGSLENCGSTALAPYLAQVPCDKKQQAYLYLPVNNAQDLPCAGYRVLTKLAILNDPMIEQVGCPLGCGGIPAGMVDDPEKYNYGIAEGIPLNQFVTPPIPTVDPPTCSVGNPCYCCNTPPNCNVYTGIPGICNGNAYENINDCIAETACTD